MSNPESKSGSVDYPLPVVNMDTAEAALADLHESGHDDYLLNSFEQLLETQPVAAGCVMSYLEGTAETEHELFVAEKAVALFHEMLRKQAAAAELNQTLD